MMSKVGVSTNYTMLEDDESDPEMQQQHQQPDDPNDPNAENNAWQITEAKIMKHTKKLKASLASRPSSIAEEAGASGQVHGHTGTATRDEEHGGGAEKEHLILTHDRPAPSPQKKFIQRIVTATLIVVYLFSAIVFSLRPEVEEPPPAYAINDVYGVFTYTDTHRTCDIMYADLTFQPPDRGVLPINVTVVLQELTDLGWVLVPDQMWVVSVSKDEGLSDGASGSNLGEVEHRGGTEEVHHEYTFNGPSNGNTNLRFFSISDSPVPMPFTFKLVQTPQAGSLEVLYAAIILVFIYTLISFEIVHRTLAAVIGSFVALMFVAVLKERYPLEVVVQWIDYETVALLFGMMIMVNIVSQTGAFEFAAIKAYKYSKGNLWVLVTILVFTTAIFSAFLDNVTTILLIAPVTIRLCQVINIDPRPVLIAEVLFCNIGGTATGVGDPPNVIILGDPLIQSYGIDFAEFTIHMMVGSIFCLIAGYGVLKLQMRGVALAEDGALAALEREIFVWRRSLQTLNPNIAEEAAMQKRLENRLAELEELLEQEKIWGRESKQQSVADLEEQYKIHNMPLFVNCMIVMSITILLFFIHSVPGIYLSIGWISIMGAFALVMVAGNVELEKVLEKLEWATLIFFAALFVMMECIDELGLLTFIGEQLAILIGYVNPDYQLIVSITLVIWVSAISSAFIDNIPFTTAMIPIIVEVAEDPNLNVPLRPLVWSLAYGACLGGNGTQIGASANVVASGLAEQYGYAVTFNYFFKFGFPMMLVTVFVANLYLLFAHGWLEWNNGA